MRYLAGARSVRCCPSALTPERPQPPAAPARPAAWPAPGLGQTPARSARGGRGSRCPPALAAALWHPYPQLSPRQPSLPFTSVFPPGSWERRRPGTPPLPARTNGLFSLQVSRPLRRSEGWPSAEGGDRRCCRAHSRGRGCPAGGLRAEDGVTGRVPPEAKPQPRSRRARPDLLPPGSEHLRLLY